MSLNRRNLLGLRRPKSAILWLTIVIIIHTYPHDSLTYSSFWILFGIKKFHICPPVSTMCRVFINIFVKTIATITRDILWENIKDHSCKHCFKVFLGGRYIVIYYQPLQMAWSCRRARVGSLQPTTSKTEGGGVSVNL